MINCATAEVNINEEDDQFFEDFIVDPQTGITRLKEHKTKRMGDTGVPSIRTNSEFKKVLLTPENWFLTQSSILACLPTDDKGHIPLELLDYVNKNFNTYPVSEIDSYIDEFKGSLLFHNHNPERAYGFMLDVKPRPVQVGSHTLVYIDILTAVNRNIDPTFAKGIEDRTLKYMSWAHSSGVMKCAVCGSTEQSCKHFLDMIYMNTPRPPQLGGKPYGILHIYSPTFHVYESSYLDVKPAFDGAISSSVNQLPAPLEVMVSRNLFLEKARYAAEFEEDLKPMNIVKELLQELGI